MENNGNPDPPIVGTIRHQTLNDMVYDTIRRLITDLVVNPGDQLREQQLAEQLGVSKSPVREAFRRLEKTGLVDVKPFKGCFASQLSLDEFRDAMDFRRTIEWHSLAVAFPRLTDDDLNQMRSLEKAAAASFERSSKEVVATAHSELHRFIVRKAGNKLMENAYVDLLDNTLKRYLFFGLRQISGQIELWRKQHRQIFRAIEKRSLEATREALDEHLTTISRLFDDHDILLH
jgi:DNA-binding GntR family transcriptional regulator